MQLPCDQAQVVEKRLPTPHLLRSHGKVATLEVLIPRGARFIYGLLGADFSPNDSRELTIQVSSSTVFVPITDWSLARGLDSVRTGIPPWAAHDILNAASIAAADFGSGLLRFSIGAFGEIGSNVWVFRNLTKAVVALLLIEEPLSEERLGLILQQCFG